MNKQDEIKDFFNRWAEKIDIYKLMENYLWEQIKYGKGGDDPKIEK